MDKKFLLVGLLVGVLLGFIVGSGSQLSYLAAKDSQILQLNNQIISLNSQVTTLTGQKASLQARIDALKIPDISVIAVSFSRSDDTAALLGYWIGRANHTIRAAVYSFTYDSLGDAIIAAKNRGVDVEVYIDNLYVSSTGSEYPKLLAAGVSIKADTRSADMHHKFVVIDGAIIGTGSFNWSAAAENSNDENLIILRSTSIAQMYLGEFSRMWGS